MAYTKPNGLHHLALSTGDMKSQIAFFTDVLGMELVALYWMHGVEGCWHGFLRLNETESVAFVNTPNNASIEPVMGVSHPGNPGESSAPGTMQHLSLNVDSMDELMEMRDRIRSRGVAVAGPIHHGFCSSIYFGGPENLALEIATSHEMEHPLGGKTWIDPEVVALAGISDEELARYMHPKAYDGDRNLPQPEASPDKPAMHFAPDAPDFTQMPDDVVTEMMSETTPPQPGE